jgi:hypothetical protein
MQQQTQPQAQSAGAATSPATLLASMQQLMGMQQLQAANSGQSYSKYTPFLYSLIDTLKNLQPNYRMVQIFHLN